MSYLYHQVPKDQQGTVLEPLNSLKISNPDLYEVKVAKYQDRVHIMERRISILDCLWNDVLHFSPVAPAELKSALLEAGMEDKEWSFYQIDSSLLESENTVTYLHKDIGRISVPDDNEFVPFDFNDLPELSEIPETTKQYWKDQYAKSAKPLIFLGIPHILYRGTLDTANLPVVTV